MARGLAEQLEFLRAKGFGAIEHESHVPFLVHLGAVRQLLIDWGAREALCDAGLFHSIYGTEYFDAGIGGVDRDEVRAMIGDEAEQIAWLWCTVQRASIDPTRCSAVDRHTRATIDLGSRAVADLAELWTADMVEQSGRMSAAELRPGGRLAELVGVASGSAQAAYAVAVNSLR